MPLKGLTDEQLKAVTFEKNLLLTACPGAGKTKTLVSKIAHILLTQTKGRKRWVIAITYTNVAADTILERLDDYGIDKKNLWVGTVHSFCLEWILKPYKGYCERISKGYRILDQYEQNKLQNDIKNEFSISFFDPIPTKLNTKFEVSASPGTNHYNAAIKYHEVLEENKWIDFDLILTLSLNVIIQNPSISVRLSRLFKNILVDEYQDTNQDQYDILAAIIRHGRTLTTLIGDIDQAIFTGLGAVVKDANQIKTEFDLDAIEELNLSGCYRSTQTVIDYYRSFQDNQIDIKSRAPFNQTETGIFYNDDVSREELGVFIGEIVNDHAAKGISLKEMVILAPQWTDVISLGRRLKRALPHIEFNAPGISPIPKNRDNPWFSLIQLYFTVANPENYSRRRRMARQVLEDNEKMGLPENRNKDAIKSLLKTINTIEIDLTGSIEGFIQQLVSSYFDGSNLLESDYLAALEAKNAIVEATSERIDRHELDNSASTLPSFFSSSDGIEVKSCHSVKGEEYDVVIATGLLEGKLPHWGEIIDQPQEHTDYIARRLLYVICSRARKYVYLISETGHATRRGTPLRPTRQL